MKKLNHLLGLVLLAAFFMSCNTSGDRAKTGEAQDVNVTEAEQTFIVNPSTSVVEWTGSKPTGKHNGTINVSKGNLLVTNNTLVGGEFTLDMKTIVNKDIEKDEDRERLVGHLKSADFFDVDKHPYATFVITEVEPITGNNEFNYRLTGNLTMKDTTASVSFPARVSMKENSVEAVSQNFTIDRSIWNVKYGSKKFFDNLRDDFISDDIALKVTINANND